MASSPVTEQGRRTRARIVTAAMEVVAEKGAVGASLDDVGARASASRSQLYHYFDDKADLLRAVAEATNDTVLDGQRELFEQLGSREGFRRWADGLVHFQESEFGQRGCPIATLLGQVGERDDQARMVLAGGFDRWETSIRTGLAAMLEDGELAPDTDIDWLAGAILASLQGGLILTQARRDPGQLRRALDGALTLLDIYRAD